VIWNQSADERERHIRAFLYMATAFGLAVLGYVQMGFDRWQTFGYAVSAYVILNALNYRAMFVRRTPPAKRTDRDA
jgi:hypothetical protein